MADQIQIHMTATEFFELPETNTLTELIHGEIIMGPSPIPFHQDVSVNTVFILKTLTKLLGGKVYDAPLDVYLDDENVVQPDVMWIAPDSRCVVGETYVEGAPDLVVEILSPSTARHDRVTKFRLYEKYGVREYWIIDPVQRLIEVWILRGEAFQRQNIYGPDETFPSPVLNNQAIETKAIFEG